ncbi:MAG: hypothetical protein A2Y53_07945 [Chloroflexi bacterium RBG_16_47_49]|nr:MAG: hypothetical protein A2Y53_07945 [Chloroflexi bacterium RBG_16_47_49]
MQNKPEHTIIFQPVGRRVISESRSSVLNAAQDGGIALASICGGVGICDSCKIRLLHGKLTDPTLEEKALFSEGEFQAGFRLACQSFPLSDLTIEIPPESLTAPQRLQIEGQAQSVQLDPPVIPIELDIPEPTITDLRADTMRVKDSLVQKGIPLPVEFKYLVLKTISPLLRANNWHVSLAMRKGSIVAILPSKSPLLGLAVDVGTTKLAAYLCDLGTGTILAKTGAMNPQTGFGEDVISRISYSNNVSDGNKVLQSRLIDTLNEAIEELCLNARTLNPILNSDQIVEAVVVGNTAMHHLFAGLPVHQLGVAPYVPAVSEPLELDAHIIGLKIAPGAKIHLPSNIAGYVGADHVAMLLSTGISFATKTSIAIDIGTNTEITLAHNNQLLSCSCASGPAFEGAHIQAGMRAAPGAIERVQIIHGELRIQTIDNLDPVGLCGSGILDAIACMLDIGVLDHRGSFILDHPSVRQTGPKREFLLVDHKKTGNGRDLVVSRQDINEIQLAKGAIRAGIEILLEYAGISAEMVEEFIIAGAFGTYINIPSAIRIGMLPALPLIRFHQVGNAAGAGARQMLLSLEQRRLAEEIAKRVHYIELSTYPNFANIFSKSLFM